MLSSFRILGVVCCLFVCLFVCLRVYLASEDGVSPMGVGKRKIETLTPFTAPLYLYKKTGEIVDSYRDPTGKFDLKGE